MRRRDFIARVGAAGAATAFPRFALAQQAAKVPRIAFLHGVMASENIEAVLQGLADYGYVDGKNIIIDVFEAPTTPDVAAFAAKAVASKPDVILVIGATSTASATSLTNTIPIVFGTTLDPVAVGFVSNLAHPGANVTGATSFASAVAGKQFAILREILPGVSRVAFFADVDNPTVTEAVLPEARAACASLGIDLIVVEMNEGRDFAPYFAEAKGVGAQAVFLPSYAYFGRPNDGMALARFRLTHKVPTTESPASNGTSSNGVLLAYLALVNGLPTIGTGTSSDNGGLVSYGVARAATDRRLGYYVDAILKGARRGDLPVEMATTFDFVINMKTARALGITIPPAVLVQATRVIE